MPGSLSPRRSAATPTTDRPAADRAEIDPAAWLHAWHRALQDLTPAMAGRRVLALGLSGQMHGAVLVDAEGRALRPALLWPDSRAETEAARWRALPPPVRRALANPLVPGMTGPMLAWLVRHEPDTVARAAGVLLPKDALRAALVPRAGRVTDRSDASGTLLWDVAADTWSAAAVAAAGVSSDLLPAVWGSAEVVGTTLLPASDAPVVVGGADTPLAMLGAGTARGSRQINLGTGAQVLEPGSTTVPGAEPVVHRYADVDDGWYAMAALRNGGSAWAWARGVLGLTWDEFFAAAAAEGAGGVVFAPFLTGERGGVAGPHDRGGWTGLRPDTTRADLARAAVEGVAAAVAAAAGLLGAPGNGPPVVLTGGGTRPGVVQQAIADALCRPVRRLSLPSASATGAAMLAARGVGLDLTPHRGAGPVVDPTGEALRRAVPAGPTAAG